MRQLDAAVLFQFLPEFAELDKIFSRCFRFLGQRRYAHQTFNREPGQIEQTSHVVAQLIGRKTKLTPLACDVDLEENRGMRAILLCDPLDIAR